MKLFLRHKGNPALPPLIILHGLWGASENWLPIASILSEHFHIILPDLRNHGQSPHHPVHNYNSLCEDIYRLIQEYNFSSPPFIIGHSMGGKTVMALISKFPDSVRKPVIVDIAPKQYPIGDLHQSVANFTAFTSLSDFRKRQDINAHLIQHFPEDHIQQLLMKNIQRTQNGFKWKTNSKAIAGHLADLAGWQLKKAPLYTKEILFIKGELSPYIAAGDYPAIQNLFPESSFITIPRATHYLHKEQPRLLTGAILQFLSDR